MKGALRVNNGFIMVEYEKSVIKRIYWTYKCEEEKDFPGKELFIDYFLGKKVDFGDLIIDLKRVPPIFKKIYEFTREIPYGKVISYKGIAEFLGNSKLQRVVGNAMKSNPFLIVVPCHRVVRSNGSIGNFSLGSEFKKYLLNLEGVKIENEKISCLRYWWH
ncbi:MULTISPECIES: methylated-DNA--[protein]-cysteine S-methyltransferase [Dictyoglomus]|uniref:methylated-DNA--[protein]-cysteine S-methyltransferase n=1 Tax=Dictyoglomus TaxID=13 RepID=UPI000CCEB874|nr:methylated-DNA--[protein]-cysteine S-methyltransferase [Dictyoglomus turgidum]PNV78991.1 MAG: cysteine methyltransferase [Dictyoglomus turgidum]